MKNYLQGDEKVTVAAPAAVSAGDFVEVGDALYGFAEGDAASGAELVLVRRGVFRAVKASGTALAAGADLEWDDANDRFVPLASGTKVAVAVAAAASAATVVEVVLV